MVHLHVRLHIEDIHLYTKKGREGSSSSSSSIRVAPTWSIGQPRSPRFTYLLTYSRSWGLLKEPLIVHPLKNFPAFHGTRRFYTVFTRALRWSLSWAISIQSTPSHPISLRSYILVFPVVFFLLAFLPISYKHSYSPPFVLHAPPISSFLTWSF
jgi:hypothetical protein